MTLDSLLAFAGDHALLSLALVGLTLALVYTELARVFSGFKPVTPAQLTALIQKAASRIPPKIQMASSPCSMPEIED